MITIGNLERFIKAQENDYITALNEIKNGRKETHWMWYIFPQMKGLGSSWTADYYAIQSRKEAEKYLAHPILGKRLLEISQELLKIEGKSAKAILGYTDEKKLKSSMTLFYLVSKEATFYRVLQKYYEGKIDKKTQELLESDL